MIQFENVRKSYRTKDEPKVILKNLTLALPHANVGILGSNGSGKSTLLRLIAGTEAPDAGVITRKGRISWPLGFAGSFNGSLSGAENCLFVARIYGQDTEYVLEYVREFSELGSFFKMPVNSYSSGMRARLAFGVSMAIAFDYYLADEITAVGDAQFQKKCQQTFREKLSSSRIIMVSHQFATLRKYCDIGGVLRDGELTLYPTLTDAIRVHSEDAADHADADLEAIEG